MPGDTYEITVELVAKNVGEFAFIMEPLKIQQESDSAEARLRPLERTRGLSGRN